MSSVISVIAAKGACVIARGFGGRPGKLTVIGIRGDVVDAYGSDEKVSMGFHAHDVL